jgi:hypothetical protein
MPLAAANRRAQELSNSPLIGRGAHGKTGGLQSTADEIVTLMPSSAVDPLWTLKNAPPIHR